MDLHDYKDVAENYDLYIPIMYKEFDRYEGFKEFYFELAREYAKSGTVVDIACGTGAVMLHLAEAGFDVEGVDISEAMCNVARSKVRDKGLRGNIYTADMIDFKSDKKYSLAIIARCGFMHLLTPELQRAALMNIRDILEDGGILTFNTFAPNPSLQVEQMNTKENDYTYRFEYINSQGFREKVYDAISYNHFTQVMSGKWKFETFDETGKKIFERIRPFKMRQTYKQELLYLIELCGFEVVQIYGDYHKNTDETGDYVWILKKLLV